MARVILTNHAKDRLLERGIDVHQAKKIAKNGPIVKRRPNGTIVVRDKAYDGRFLEVICVEQNNDIVIKTAYYED